MSDCGQGCRVCVLCGADEHDLCGSPREGFVDACAQCPKRRPGDTSYDGHDFAKPSPQHAAMRVLPLAELSPGPHESWYQGECPRCRTTHVLMLRSEGVVPPPTLALACKLGFPVEPFTAVYEPRAKPE